MAKAASLLVALLMFPLNQIFGCLAALVGLLWLGSPAVRAGLLVYLVWMLWLDPWPGRGGYPCWRLTERLRDLWIWRAAADYFPQRLVRTAPLEPGPAHIFVCHPHGIMGCAIMGSFGTNATGFRDKFPGVRVHLLGHSAIFRIPFFREWCLLHGHGSVSRSTCDHLLSRGDSIALAPGGAKESLHASPGRMSLILKQRKGFARLACTHGASLVPVLSFGENELYRFVDPAPDSWLRAGQEALQRVLGFALPLFCGRSFAPLLPLPGALTTVVGKPLSVAKGADVDEVHQRYIAALQALYAEHREGHGYADAELRLL